MKRRTPASKDYGFLFLATILIGIVVVVLGVMMAVAHSTSRSNGLRMQAKEPLVEPARFIRRLLPKIKH